MSQTKRRMPIHNILFQTLVLLALLGLAISGCEEKENANAVREPDFSGTWAGRTIPDGPNEVPVPVDLTKSNEAYAFHYGPPLSFRLTAEKVTLEGSKLTLIIKETSGGRGDDLWKGTIVLTMRDKNHMEARIRDKDNGANWDDKAELEKKS